MTVIIITGAAGAIGSAAAARLAKRGADVMLTDLRREHLVSVKEQLLQDNPEGRVETFEIDVTRDGAAASVVEFTLEKFGGVDGCLNCAGIEQPIIPSVDLSTAKMALPFAVNVYAVVEMCAAVIRQLLIADAPGRIVNLASGAALGGGELMTAYHASKHAVLGATRSMAREYASKSIALNALCPGFVESPMVDKIAAELAELTGSTVDLRSTVPAGRFAEADEVATIAEFLLLDAPTYMTGSAVVVDGGLRA